MLEKDIEKTILQYLCALPKTFAFKVPTNSMFTDKYGKTRPKKCAQTGIADILCWHKGHCIHFEVKTKYGKQTLNQKDFESSVKSCGGNYFVVRSIYEVKTALLLVISQGHLS
jgi:penicillin-binding protein-related factor A (putative recombinase)